MIHLRPSSAHIWSRCALSPRLIAAAPQEPPSDPAREGTCAAWVAEMVLTGERETCRDMIGEAHGNGWVVDAVMANHIQRYVDMLRGYGGQVVAERKVRFNEYCEGTPDAFAALSNGVLKVDDLKYGYDIVEPTTPQVLIYAVGIVKFLGITPIRVDLGIYQPRAYHPNGIHRVRSLNAAAFQREYERIYNATVDAQSENAVATPGPHCKWCRGAAQCSAVSHFAYENHHRMLNGAQRDMTPQEMAEELAFLEKAEDVLHSRKRAVRAEAEARIQRGEQIPGWHRKSGEGKRQWKFDATTVQILTGIDPRDTERMVTPLELERRGASPEIVARLTEKPCTKAHLEQVPEGYYAAQFGGSE